MPIKRIDTTVYFVTDRDASITSYRDTLGLNNRAPFRLATAKRVLAVAGAARRKRSLNSERDPYDLPAPELRWSLLQEGLDALLEVL